MSELGHRLEKRLRFEKKEIIHLAIVSLVASFVLTMSVIDLADNYFVSLAAALIIVFLSLIIHFTAQKIVGLNLGYSSKYQMWLNGTFISVVVGFLSWGYIPLFFTGVLNFNDIPKLRAGKFRPNMMQKDLAVIGFAGPLANIILVALITPFFLASDNKILYASIVINLLIAFFSVLPIPTFEKMRKFKGGTTGLYIFIASRTAFVMIFFTVLTYALLIILFKVFTYIISLLIGLLAIYLYSKYFDKPKD